MTNLNNLTPEEIRNGESQLDLGWTIYLHTGVFQLDDDDFNKRMLSDDDSDDPKKLHHVITYGLFPGFKWVVARLPRYDLFTPTTFKRGYNVVVLWRHEDSDTIFSEEYLLQKDFKEDCIWWHKKATRLTWPGKSEPNHHHLFEDPGIPNKRFNLNSTEVDQLD